MSFIVFADGTANIPASHLGEISLIPCHYTIDGQSMTYDGNLELFDVKGYYDRIRNGAKVVTSLINTGEFIEAFRPALLKGLDVIYVSMASGISGTFQAARVAAEELMEEFRGRIIRIIDSKTCGMGTGMQVLMAEELREEGYGVEQAADIVNDNVGHACSYFTVDNVGYLVSTGRVSRAVATACSILNIKPILFGSAEARIEQKAICKGRKKSIMMLADKYREKVVDAAKHLVAISHGDCLKDAEELAARIRAIAEPRELMIVEHEPFSGAHVGPGMLGLFFYGDER